MRRWESTISRSFIAFHKAETSLLRRERTEWIAIRLSEWSSSLGNPRFPIDIPIVPLFSTRDQRNLCTFYSRVIAFASLWKLETLNFETANLDRLDYIILIFLIQRIDFFRKIVSKKNPSERKIFRLNIFVKLRILSSPSSLSSFLYLPSLFPHKNTSSVHFYKQSLCRKFSKHRTDSKWRKDWRKKGKAIRYFVGGQRWKYFLKGIWRSHVARANREKRFLARNIGVLEGYRMNNAE